MLPKNASKECRELGKCALQEYKGYRTCAMAGSCHLATDEPLRPATLDERFGPGTVFTRSEFEAAEK